MSQSYYQLLNIKLGLAHLATVVLFSCCSTWKAKEGPKRDVYNIGDNPQYHLEVKTSQPCAIWLLLTRHITDKADFADNKEFITLLVYKTNGKRIFYPSKFNGRAFPVVVRFEASTSVVQTTGVTSSKWREVV